MLMIINNKADRRALFENIINNAVEERGVQN